MFFLSNGGEWDSVFLMEENGIYYMIYCIYGGECDILDDIL